MYRNGGKLGRIKSENTMPVFDPEPKEEFSQS